MRILICNWKDLTHPNAGGAEVYTQECARRWVADGHQVTLVCASSPGRPAEEHVDGVRVIRQGSRIGVYAATARYLHRHGHRFDVLIDEINTRPFFAHRHAPGTPVVALAHQVAREVWFDEVPLPLALVGRHLLEPRWLRAYADVPTLTVSESSAESLRWYGLTNVSIVPEGVTLPTGLAAPVKAPTPRLVFCGRMVSMKRPDEAIAAFVRARSDLPPGAELHMIGSGPLEASLRRDAPEGVVFHGRVTQEEKFALLGSAHALLATSVREGWGLVVSEAAAVGTPAIAYDAPGLCDSVRAGRGVLVRPTVEALADGIVANLPSMTAAPPRPIPHGGAAGWDDVAEQVLERIAGLAGRRSLVRSTRVGVVAA